MVPKDPDFYLASTEGYGLQEPRRCYALCQVETPERNDLLLVRVDPPILYDNQDLAEVVVAARHKGVSVLAIREWPVSVHVVRLTVNQIIQPRSEPLVLSVSDVQNIAWGELYDRIEDAARAGRGG